MSLIGSNSTYLATAIRDHAPEHESFRNFFECWLTEQNQNLHDLKTVSMKYQSCNTSNLFTSASEKEELCSLIDRTLKQYENYYHAKSSGSKQDVLAMLTPTWRSSLEDAFLWIGGWRPSMAFHLLYSKSGLQLDDGKLSDLIKGLSTGDLADLSPAQITQVDELQRKTIKKEKEITEKMAKQQETMMSSGETGGNVAELESDRVESALKQKEKGLEEIIHKADDLRLQTLKTIIDMLTPIQAVHFLIAAAELHLRLHDWGKKMDANHDRDS
ncbi:hypothetical protein UlMin_001015 [Ulmus minor]